MRATRELTRTFPALLAILCSSVLPCVSSNEGDLGTLTVNRATAVAGSLAAKGRLGLSSDFIATVTHGTALREDDVKSALRGRLSDFEEPRIRAFLESVHDSSETSVRFLLRVSGRVREILASERTYQLDSVLNREWRRSRMKGDPHDFLAALLGSTGNGDSTGAAPELKLPLRVAFSVTTEKGLPDRFLANLGVVDPRGRWGWLHGGTTESSVVVDAFMSHREPILAEIRQEAERSPMFQQTTHDEAQITISLHVEWLTAVPKDSWDYMRARFWRPAIQAEIVCRRTDTERVWFRSPLGTTDVEGIGLWFVSEDVSSESHRTLDLFWKEVGRAVFDAAEEEILSLRRRTAEPARSQGSGAQ